MGCPTAYDKIEHYAVCPKAWAFLQRPRPGGLGLLASRHNLEGFFMVEQGMDQQEKLAMAIGVYAVSRTVAQLRSESGELHAEALLRLHAREGLRGSKAKKVLAQSLSP